MKVPNATPDPALAVALDRSGHVVAAQRLPRRYDDDLEEPDRLDGPFGSSCARGRKPAALDSTAFGRIYASAVELRPFERHCLALLDGVVVSSPG